MPLQKIILISNQEINLPGFTKPINIRDIKAIMVKDLTICEILLHSGKLYTGLEHLPKSEY